ncbi:MAG: peroxiredoxin [Deltaproteobacteria bacterium]|nr:peroxiredoxin [Deltaproteobacteria bacterium]
MTARVGHRAPDFTTTAVVNGDFKEVSLADSRGKWTVLFFYPLDFTFICPTEITEFSKRIDEFKELNAVVLGCSTDSHHSHKAWIKNGLGEIKYPLLADMTREVSRQYGVLMEEKGFSLRGTFIIDPEGKLRMSQINDTGVGRSVGEVIRTLAALQTGELCPVEWKPGQKTLGK